MKNVHEEERSTLADELLEQWINGNCNYVASLCNHPIIAAQVGIAILSATRDIAQSNKFLSLLDSRRNTPPA